MKKTYHVYIEETVSDIFEIEAESEKEALNIAEESYNNGEYIIGVDNVVDRRMKLADNENAAWYEL